MKTQKFTILLTMIIAAFATGQASAQEETFSSPSVDYSFKLPNGQWQQTVKPSDTNPNVEYVFGLRVDGHLEVRKLAARKERLTTDIIQDEEQKLQFLPGYVAGKEENFAGAFFRGVIFNYEYVRAGRPMSGRMYFLRVNDTTVYVLRFSGLKDKLRSIENQTDSIARTFTVK